MFGIGSTELLVILVVALLVLGPKSLASVSRSLGKAMGEFRRVSTDFQRTLNVEVAQDELREAKRKKGAQQARTETAEQGEAGAKPGNGVNIPEDSPLAKALNKAKETAENNSGQNPHA